MMNRKKRSRSPTLFPRNRQILVQLGENIKLARKRRKLSLNKVAERADTSRITVSNIEKGSPKVAIGHYINVLASLHQADDLLLIAADDLLGRKLQDIALQRSGAA